ncbi:MAG: phosphoribosylglycinamide formyltransferase [Bacteroidales bacterium]|nr:phosphoribosylglycinamide formyltransferase [Bacteroidales bacterium]
MDTVKLALFASGNGTNVQQITEYFADKAQVMVDCVVYNVKDAYVAQRAQKLGIPSFYHNKKDFMETDVVANLMKQRGIDWIILAGFLLLVPENLLAMYPNHIINIHPALLPNYGGKGMYGHHVHEAVVANHEKESGITIHLVDKHYDRGTILFQAKCPLTEEDTADTLAQKIHLLEKEFFPKVIEKTVLN